MILLDCNILLLAYNRQAAHHAPVLNWLNRCLLEGRQIGLPWVSVWAFLRISTNRRAFPAALPGEVAVSVVRQLLEQPNIRLISPGERHLELLSRFIGEEAAVGTLVTDAVVAALALENAAVVASTDEDFRRFAVPWINPAKGQE